MSYKDEDLRKAGNKADAIMEDEALEVRDKEKDLLEHFSDTLEALEGGVSAHYLLSSR